MTVQRRSKDGYISATAMFWAAFPWAKFAQEKDERDYLKGKEETSQDEMACQIWIAPRLGLSCLILILKGQHC